ncbi:hypothetical protein [Fervidobacterium thailandense]|uniref:Uncharacterized protein n=1 Tax=Fervidobacterium thailandense TaxID=1008305 RepID=A0A1E3G2Z2_9BACT|nr:hypothetical protein [Fervidobacterium thailandense]ODN30038.1 hypothetical protein A4H02_07615 [Fervidobacterium thailandense]
MEDLRYIAEVCLNDERIYEIVSNIACMSEEQLREFKNKVIAYFMNKSSQDDMEAYKFYKIVLENDNAKKILEIYEQLKGG